MLSRAGLDLVARLSAEVERSLSALTQGLTHTEQLRLRSLLERMLGHHEQGERPAQPMDPRNRLPRHVG